MLNLEYSLKNKKALHKEDLKEYQNIFINEDIKFLQKGVVTLIPTAEIACIVTDTHIPIECENYLLDHGIEVKKVEN